MSDTVNATLSLVSLVLALASVGCVFVLGRRYIRLMAAARAVMQVLAPLAEASPGVTHACRILRAVGVEYRPTRKLHEPFRVQ